MKFAIVLTFFTLAFGHPIISQAHSYSDKSEPVAAFTGIDVDPEVLRQGSDSCPEVIPIPRIDNGSVTPKIVGGSPSPDLAPYLVGLFSPSGVFCSGFLVSKRWIISAAHCRITTDWIVGLGGAVANSGTPRAIETVISHPQFSLASPDNDIAAVKISTDAPLGTAFALINFLDILPFPFAYVKSVGYGITEEGGGGAGVLRSVDVPVVPYYICKDFYPSILTDNMICAGQPGCDACQGDSGGPILQFDTNGQAVVVGITSFGRGCGTFAPGVYTDIAKYVAWLRVNGVEFGVGSGEQLF